MEKLRPQLGDPMQRVQLGLAHARAALRQSRDEETQQVVAPALLRSFSHVGKRLEGVRLYVYRTLSVSHATERTSRLVRRKLLVWGK